MSGIATIDYTYSMHMLTLWPSPQTFDLRVNAQLCLPWTIATDFCVNSSSCFCWKAQKDTNYTYTSPIASTTFLFN